MSTEPSDTKGPAFFAVMQVFDAVRRAQHLAQAMDAAWDDLDEMPRWELWCAVSERLSKALEAVVEAEGLPQ